MEYSCVLEGLRHGIVHPPSVTQQQSFKHSPLGRNCQGVVTRRKEFFDLAHKDLFKLCNLSDRREVGAGRYFLNKECTFGIGAIMDFPAFLKSVKQRRGKILIAPRRTDLCRYFYFVADLKMKGIGRLGRASHGYLQAALNETFLVLVENFFNV